MQLIQWLGVALTVPLQILLLGALLRGYYKRYPFLLLLIIVEFLATVVGAATKLDVGSWNRETAKFYYIAEALEYILIFALQAHLLYQAIDQTKNRGRLIYVIAGGLLYAALSTWLSYDPRWWKWMSQLVRNFSFGSMLLNLMLWTVLVRQPDRTRLLITAGVGIQLAGSSIGHSLLQLAPSLVKAGNLVLLVCYLLFLLTIWRGVTKPPTGGAQGPRKSGPNADPDEEVLPPNHALAAHDRH